MNPEKAWTRLNVHVQHIVHTSEGERVEASIPLANLLKGLPRGPFLMGMVRETLDLFCLGELEERLSEEIHNYAIYKHWPLRGGPLFWRCKHFAGLAVYEVLAPRSERCAACQGRGWTANGPMTLACPNCQSAGARTLSARMRAELAGIPWKTWRDGWAARYEGVHAIACGWSSDAISHLARGLRMLEKSSH